MKIVMEVLMSTKQRKEVFITGGTGSIGEALVRRFYEEKINVTFQYFSNTECAKQLEHDLGAKGIAMDFMTPEKLPGTKFDIIVNNAGINITSELAQDVALDDWNRTLAVNLTFPFIVVKEYLPGMLQRRWGRIVNISSIFGLRGTDNNLPYNVSKHGMSGLTKTLAKEAGEFGITCNEICPGPVDSALIRRIAKANEAETGQSVNEYLRELSDEIPARRMASPKEIASLAAFLCSDAAGYLNGVSIPLDGGLIA